VLRPPRFPLKDGSLECIDFQTAAYVRVRKSVRMYRDDYLSTFYVEELLLRFSIAESLWTLNRMYSCLPREYLRNRSSNRGIVVACIRRLKPDDLELTIFPLNLENALSLCLFRSHYRDTKENDTSRCYFFVCLFVKEKLKEKLNLSSWCCDDRW